MSILINKDTRVITRGMKASTGTLRLQPAQDTNLA